MEYGGEGVIFDPSSNGYRYPTFVSHAHADHASAFRHPERIKYATEETYRLLEAMGWRNLANWEPIVAGGRVRLGEIEVRVHNAGHVLGSVQFEAITPEGTVLYTGDFSLDNSYTMKCAEAVDCDILVIETTFGAPMFRFPRRREVALEMVRWAVMEAIPSGLVPTFKADSIGNSQEIISIFNSMTKVPVVTAKSVTGVSDVYRDYGHRLEYTDSRSEEGRELMESGRCVLVAPKGSKLSYGNLEVALASGWATIFGRRRKAFPLSDHADFRDLITFIRRCKPKRVLTFHGGSMTRDFPNYVRQKLGIDARPLTTREETLAGPVNRGENRMRACCDQLIRTVRIPGFVYTNSWLVKEMARKGFTRSETEAALEYLLERKVLTGGESGVALN